MSRIQARKGASIVALLVLTCSLFLLCLRTTSAVDTSSISNMSDRPRERPPRARPAPYSRQRNDSGYYSRGQLSRSPSDSSLSSRSPSPPHRRRSGPPPRRRYSSRRRRSPSRSPSPRSIVPPLPEDKPWYKKKTFWGTLASAATIVAVMPTWRSANASRSSASASHRSADASTRSARAVEKSLEFSERSANAAMQSAEASLRSARAVERSTKAVEKSARAVTNTAVAGGHQDHDGTYLGPPPGGKKPESAPAPVPEKKNEMVERGRSVRRDDGSRSSRGRKVEARPRMKEIEYEPLANYLGGASVPAGVPVRV